MICCQDPLECERAEHHFNDTSKFEVGCTSGFFECPATLGGGCCPDGYGCSQGSCYQLLEDESTTPSTTSPIDPRDSMEMEMEPNTKYFRGREIPSAITTSAQTAPTYPCGPFGGGTCQSDKTVDLSGSDLRLHVLKAGKAYFAKSSNISNKGKRDEVLDIDTHGGGGSVLKAGETPECTQQNGCISLEPIQDPLSLLSDILTNGPALPTDEIQLPTNGFAHPTDGLQPPTDDLQLPTDGLDLPTDGPDGLEEPLGTLTQTVDAIILTLTQGFGVVITQVPVVSLLPSNDSDAIPIIGNFQNPLRSSGNSFKAPPSTSTIWTRTFSLQHIQYMCLVFCFQFMNGRR
ncbi:hypothetical protein AA313_de0206196 [Arthrobotrys entomopaga]|nr:hypothetical protein AA313_de0206196 [Arthrobotrys entomopaga]